MCYQVPVASDDNVGMAPQCIVCTLSVTFMMKTESIIINNIPTYYILYCESMIIVYIILRIHHANVIYLILLLFEYLRVVKQLRRIRLS